MPKPTHAKQPNEPTMIPTRAAVPRLNWLLAFRADGLAGAASFVPEAVFELGELVPHMESQF